MRGRAETLTSGTRLGPYEIVSLLGSGGMGEVYRARDVRLGREVALKVLPGRTDDAGRFRRFQTEAKAAASLTHPHIVAVHDVGEADGTAYIVSELAPGGTLTALLDRGPLSARRLLDLAIPLADALAAAHANGIVHRDFKPDNVLLGQDGSPKIADFGLAKYLAPVESDGDTAGTTLQDERTREGTVFGTVGYMSPEQAEGRPLDFRSDQFSFGSVLYEMATGTKAFRKSTAVDTLAAILHEEPPPIRDGDARIPAPLRWTIERCLAKDPAGRYDSTGDVARELAKIREHLPETASASVPTRVDSSRRWAFGALAAAVLTGGILAGRFVWPLPPAPVPTFQQLTFRRGNLLRARYTPDGGSMLYSAAWEGAPAEIFTARLDGTESRPFGVKNADVLAVSSKGEVAVLLKEDHFRNWGGEGTLAVLPLSGGTPRELLQEVAAADWSPDGTQLAVARYESGEYRIEYPIDHILYRSKLTLGLFGMRVSGSGTQVAFVEWTRTNTDLKIVDASGRARTLLRVNSPETINGLVWQPGDRAILIGLDREGSVKGDLGDLAAVDLGGHVRTLYRGSWLAPLDLLSSGQLLIRQAKGSVDVMFGSLKEPPERNLGWLANSVLDDMSNDGGTVLLDDDTDMFLRRTDGSPAVRLGPGLEGSLSPDGRFVLARTESVHEISIIPTGPGSVRKVSIGNLVLKGSPIMLLDGKTILFAAAGEDEQRRVYATDDTGKTPRAVSDRFRQGLSWAVSPGRQEFAACDARNGLKIFRLDGGPARAVSGFDPDDEIVGWTSDNGLYVTRGEGEVPLRVERFDLTTGRKTPWKTLVPPNEAGVFAIGTPVITPDGKFWAYDAARNTSDELWQVTGLPGH